MRLKWVRDDTSMYTYRAESIRYRFIMIVPPRARTTLWVQHTTDDWGSNPIDQRLCRSRRYAEHVAQRFENQDNPRRLR
jgi:hypothetical protein